MKTVCAWEGCERESCTRGYCHKHHQWLWNHGKLPPLPAPEELFFAQVVFEPMSGCWLWAGASHTYGYGLFHGSDTCGGYAHRFSYEIHKGPIPDGLEVRHICNNTSCVNPDHLCVGTHAENMADMAKAGTQKGEKQHSAIVTEEDVLRIRELRATGMKYREIGKLYRIKLGSIRSIAVGINWPHVGGPLDVPEKSKTHCVHGHEFTPENTYYYKGSRTCRECARANGAKYRNSKKKGVAA